MNWTRASAVMALFWVGCGGPVEGEPGGVGAEQPSAASSGPVVEHVVSRGLLDALTPDEGLLLSVASDDVAYRIEHRAVAERVVLETADGAQFPLLPSAAGLTFPLVLSRQIGALCVGPNPPAGCPLQCRTTCITMSGIQVCESRCPCEDRAFDRRNICEELPYTPRRCPHPRYVPPFDPGDPAPDREPPIDPHDGAGGGAPNDPRSGGAGAPSDPPMGGSDGAPNDPSGAGSGGGAPPSPSDPPPSGGGSGGQGGSSGGSGGSSGGSGSGSGGSSGGSGGSSGGSGGSSGGSGGSSGGSSGGGRSSGGGGSYGGGGY